MFDVLIADDESLIREGLRQSIDWNGLELNVVGEATDGEEAIEAIMKWKPSIVITDIKMPKKNGLEVTKFAKQFNPEMIVIILSGYSDFEYARQGMKWGAFDFILKPTVFSEVVEVISRAVQTIHLEEKRKQEFSRFKAELKQNIDFYRTAFLHKLIVAPQLDEPIKQNLNETLWLYEMQEDGPFYLLACKVDEFDSLRSRSEEQLRVYLLALENHIAQFLQSVAGTYLVPMKDDLFVIVLRVEESQSEQGLTQLCERLQFSLKDHYLPVTVSLGVSSEKRTLQELNKAYLEAGDALEHILYLGHEAIIFFEGLYDQLAGAAAPHLTFAENCSAIVKAVQIGDCENAVRHVSLLFQLFEYHQANRETIQSVCTELGAQIYTVMYKAPSDDPLFNREEYYNEIRNAQTSEKFKNTVEAFVKQVSGQIFRKTHTNHKKLVQQVLDLIRANYMKDLTLAWVSKQVHLNSSYLSRLLKNECGENFTLLLTKQRIEQAKLLLKDPTVKIYEVSEKVGFVDPQYFAVIFKKQTGMSPSEYRDHFEEIF